MDATSMLQQLQSGSTTPQQLAEDAITKIKATHAQLNAATAILEKEAAQQLQNLPNGSLKGLPISVKECYAVAGKQITSGSKRMPPINCKEDATVVQKLKAAGAVIVARGNTSEFLMGRETDNLVYGTTNNSINPAITAGGSSGGDGSLVGSGSVAFGIGTDIGGSCRYPAVFNGIVGLKPASGQIDKTGIFPAAGNTFVETLNSPGMLCRSVRDARLVYNVIGNKQLKAGSPLNNVQVYTSTNFRVKIKDESISNALHAATDFFKQQRTVKDLDIPDSGSHYVDFGGLMVGGFLDKMYEWSVTAKGERLSYLTELIRKIKGKPTISGEFFAMLLPFLIVKPSSAKLEKLITKVDAAREKYNDMLKDGVLILPTTGILAPANKKFYPQYNKPGVVDIITPVSFCNIYNLSCITLPAWNYRTDKTKNPPGIQLVTAGGNEEMLLNVAEKLEPHLSKWQG